MQEFRKLEIRISLSAHLSPSLGQLLNLNTGFTHVVLYGSGSTSLIVRSALISLFIHSALPVELLKILHLYLGSGFQPDNCRILVILGFVFSVVTFSPLSF